MAKVDAAFPHEIFRSIHKPIRDRDEDAGHFLERWTLGMQRQYETFFGKMDGLLDLLDPEKTPKPRLLKDIVGLTADLDNITRDITDQDLRKLIALAVSLWKQKGLEVGYKNIVRLFTGKGVRIFNWFDFRYIVGEQAFGEEQLGEDSWFISTPGVVGTNPLGNVVLLLPFEGVPKDRSINRNDAVDHAHLDYGVGGAQTGSERHAIFDGGNAVPPGGGQVVPGDFLTVPWHPAYAWGLGDFTIEVFVRTTRTQDATLFRERLGSTQIWIEWLPSTNQVRYTLSDGTTTVTETKTCTVDLDGGTWLHVALGVSRGILTPKSRLWVNGNESTPGAALGALGDLSMTGAELFIGASGLSASLFDGEMDSFRISKSDQYIVANASIPPPGVAFVEYQEEQLDEFKSDIRVVDRGDLNRTLTRRILNLMRPVSERLNVIYIDFFEDFVTGKGDLVSGGGASFLDAGDLVLPAGAVEIAETAQSPTWRDYYVQSRFAVVEPGSFGVRFLIVDASNFYRFALNSVSKTATLERVVAGVATALAAPVPVDFVQNAFYIATVTTDLNDAGSASVLKCYQDSNLLFEVTDGSFLSGTWAVESFAGGKSRVSDLEMFTLPLDVEFVLPGFNL